jgi:hypothetical protein
LVYLSIKRIFKQQNHRIATIRAREILVWRLKMMLIKLKVKLMRSAKTLDMRIIRGVKRASTFLTVNCIDN